MSDPETANSKSTNVKTKVIDAQMSAGRFDEKRMQSPGSTECDAQMCEVLRVVLVPHDALEKLAHKNIFDRRQIENK